MSFFSKKESAPDYCPIECECHSYINPLDNYCSNCGKELKKTGTMCPNCEGEMTFYSNECPHCGVVSDNGIHCPECGEWIERGLHDCPHCGAVIIGRYIICNSCFHLTPIESMEDGRCIWCKEQFRNHNFKQCDKCGNIFEDGYPWGGSFCPYCGWNNAEESCKIEYTRATLSKNGIGMMVVRGIVPSNIDASDYFENEVRSIATKEFPDGYNVFYPSDFKSLRPNNDPILYMAIITRGFSDLPFRPYSE